MSTRQKGGKVSKAGFKIANYNYMNDMGLTGWAWEFKKRQAKNSPLGLPKGFGEIRKDSGITKEDFNIPKDYTTLFVKSSSLVELCCRVRGATVKKSPEDSTIDGYKIKGVKIIDPPQYAKKFKRLYQWESFKPTDSEPMEMLKEEKSPYSIMFIIDVSGNKQLILNEFQKQLTAWKREIKRLFSMPDKRIRKEWQTELMIYDLKEKYGRSFQEIAALMYPIEKNDHDSGYKVTKKVRKNYDRAKQLIQREYKHYIPEIPF